MRAVAEAGAEDDGLGVMALPVHIDASLPDFIVPADLYDNSYLEGGNRRWKVLTNGKKCSCCHIFQSMFWFDIFLVEGTNSHSYVVAPTAQKPFNQSWRVISPQPQPLVACSSQAGDRFRSCIKHGTSNHASVYARGTVKAVKVTSADGRFEFLPGAASGSAGPEDAGWWDPFASLAIEWDSRDGRSGSMAKVRVWMTGAQEKLSAAYCCRLSSASDPPPYPYPNSGVKKVCTDKIGGSILG